MRILLQYTILYSLPCTMQMQMIKENAGFLHDHFRSGRFKDYESFQTSFACDISYSQVVNWWKKLIIYELTMQSFYSTACFISTFDHSDYGDISLRWQEAFLKDCWRHNATSSPIDHKNPVFLMQIKE